MFKAHIVEVDATTVGLGGGDEQEVVFYSAGGRFDAIDGSRYRDLASLNHAFRLLSREAARPAAVDGRVRSSGPTTCSAEPAGGRLAA